MPGRILKQIFPAHGSVKKISHKFYASQKAKMVKTNVFINRRAIRYITPILISVIITSLQKGQKALNISVFLAQYWLIAKGLSRVVLKTKENLSAFF